MEEKINFGKFIQLKRKEKGLSQKDMADKLFVTESAVSKWERGISYPDISMLQGICEVLSVTEHELLTASDDYRLKETEKNAETGEQESAPGVSIYKQKIKNSIK